MDLFEYILSSRIDEIARLFETNSSSKLDYILNNASNYKVRVDSMRQAWAYDEHGLTIVFRYQPAHYSTEATSIFMHSKPNSDNHILAICYPAEWPKFRSKITPFWRWILDVIDGNNEHI